METLNDQPAAVMETMREVLRVDPTCDCPFCQRLIELRYISMVVRRDDEHYQHLMIAGPDAKATMQAIANGILSNSKEPNG